MSDLSSFLSTDASTFENDDRTRTTSSINNSDIYDPIPSGISLESWARHLKTSCDRIHRYPGEKQIYRRVKVFVAHSNTLDNVAKSHIGKLVSTLTELYRYDVTVKEMKEDANSKARTMAAFKQETANLFSDDLLVFYYSGGSETHPCRHHLSCIRRIQELCIAPAAFDVLMILDCVWSKAQSIGAGKELIAASGARNKVVPPPHGFTAALVRKLEEVAREHESITTAGLYEELVRRHYTLMDYAQETKRELSHLPLHASLSEDDYNERFPIILQPHNKRAIEESKIVHYTRRRCWQWDGQLPIVRVQMEARINQPCSLEDAKRELSKHWGFSTNSYVGIDKVYSDGVLSVILFEISPGLWYLLQPCEPDEMRVICLEGVPKKYETKQELEKRRKARLEAWIPQNGNVNV